MKQKRKFLSLCVANSFEMNETVVRKNPNELKKKKKNNLKIFQIINK
jgi:hypothetical protein